MSFQLGLITVKVLTYCGVVQVFSIPALQLSSFSDFQLLHCLNTGKLHSFFLSNWQPAPLPVRDVAAAVALPSLRLEAAQVALPSPRAQAAAVPLPARCLYKCL